MNETNPWLVWARTLQAMSQNGLLYTQDSYDRERYESIRRMSSEMMEALTGVPFDEALSHFVKEIGHATPKVDVRGVVFRDAQILLVKERSDGLWTLPGGWAEVNDTPAEATVREVREESGFECRATKLLAAYDVRFHGHPEHAIHIFKLFFQCEIESGEAKASEETEAVGFFDEEDLPDLSLHRTTPEEIHRMFDHLRDKRLPTDFD